MYQFNEIQAFGNRNFRFAIKTRRPVIQTAGILLCLFAVFWVVIGLLTGMIAPTLNGLITIISAILMFSAFAIVFALTARGGIALEIENHRLSVCYSRQPVMMQFLEGTIITVFAVLLYFSGHKQSVVALTAVLTVSVLLIISYFFRKRRIRFDLDSLDEIRLETTQPNHIVISSTDGQIYRIYGGQIHDVWCDMLSRKNWKNTLRL